MKICMGHPIFLQIGEVRARAKIFRPNITKGTMEPRVDFFGAGFDLEFEITQVTSTNQY